MSKQRPQRENQERTYESDMAGLLSLRLIAAPDPKDDLSDEELTAFCQDPQHSPELIRHLIDFVKAM
jgi:hypothetical protein